MKALKAYNTEAITRFHQRKDHNTEIVETPQDDPPGPPVPENDLPDLPESDQDSPDDPILYFVNSQCHSSEDLDQALQAYQAYQVPCPQDSTMTPERSINHHFNRSLLPSGGLMADVPCLDHSLDGCKGYPDDVQTTKHARRTHARSRGARTPFGVHVSPFGASSARF